MFLIKKLILASALAFCFVRVFAQTGSVIVYTISFPNAIHHEAEIVMTIPHSPKKAFKIRMSRSSTGRYSTQEFGKNIYNVSAKDLNGNPVVLKQIEGDVYQVSSKHPNTVIISYTLFANFTDGTYASINQSHAHLNFPAVCMWIPGLEERAVQFRFNNLDTYGWKVATQLKYEGSNHYSAPNFQYMMDSPAELSDFQDTTWAVKNTDGKVEKITLAVHSDDSKQIIDNLGKMIQKIIPEEMAVFGELPVYDFGKYSILVDVNPENSGDGMEHRNSTSIVRPFAKVEGNELKLLSSFSHEYFHSWNVKRIRPKSLEPFNYEHANMSSELWFAEGFTEYYGNLILNRSGFLNLNDFTQILSNVLNIVLNSPAAANYSANQMSRYAVFSDSGVSTDPINDNNIFTSYYYYGEAIALALDLRLRSSFNLTLDDYMRTVWLNRGKIMKPYTNMDLQDDLAKLTGNSKFAADFFSKYVNGINKNDYGDLLYNAGMLLRKKIPGHAWAGPMIGKSKRGSQITVNSEGFIISASTIKGTPLYKAGLDVGDIILSADGMKIRSAGDFDNLLADRIVGDHIKVNFRNRFGLHETNIILEEDPTLEIITFEKAGIILTKNQELFRTQWLSSKR